jgi:hypothetical protein
VSAERASCARHPEREARAVCSRCGDFACEACFEDPQSTVCAECRERGAEDANAMLWRWGRRHPWRSFGLGLAMGLLPLPGAMLAGAIGGGTELGLVAVTVAALAALAVPAALLAAARVPPQLMRALRPRLAGTLVGGVVVGALFSLR